MTVSKEVEAQILRLHRVEKWPPGTIATQLGIHHDVVDRVLASDGVPAVLRVRGRLWDPYVPFIRETLERHPSLHASRVFAMVRARGYPGVSQGHLRRGVAELRPRPAAEAFLRLATLPGEQAQVDWAHFGRISVDGCERPLVAFVMVLSWSRRIFLRFYLDQRMGSFLDGHVRAFEAFGGVPRVLLYDNLKSAVLERFGDVIRFNEKFLELAKHYLFEPRPVAVARGNEKGRVERAIRYVRGAFFAAREVATLERLNEEAVDFCTGLSSERLCPERLHPSDPPVTVGEAFAQERERLMKLPSVPFPVIESVEVRVRKTPYFRFDRNDYSVPHDRAHRTLTAWVEQSRIRVTDGSEVVAVHDRCWGKGKVVEDPSHVAALVTAKRRARLHRGQNHLTQVAPRITQLLQRAAERGQNLGAATNQVLKLLDLYGAEELRQAVDLALANPTDGPHALRHILAQRRHDSGRPPVVALDTHVDQPPITLHSLERYDRLAGRAVAPAPTNRAHDPEEEK